ncbi:MAG: methyltransferase [Euryarchaeota archaeon]|nr:methyltransferase [Euryarchaeota archaeon]
MKQKELERLLQGAPAHPSPTAALEQYLTPARSAAAALYFAASQGDISGKRVADLGCGTGILAVGAGLLGASEVVGVDIDERAVEAARGFGSEMGLKLEFRSGDIRLFHGEFDTVIMNPPFGAQRRHADRPFLQKAFEVAPVVYSFHLARTEDWVRREASGAGFTVTHKNKYVFAIRHLYEFHRKERQEVEVLLFRMESGR